MSDKAKKEVISWAQTIIIAIVIALFINNFIIVNAQVPTGSMENIIMPNDRIVAFRLSYIFSEPKRGDIVVFKYPDDTTGKTLYVKRVIGLPGDEIDIKDGKVFINNELLEELYIKEPMRIDPPQHFSVPEDSYFMMGDNRNWSEDARYWNDKYIVKDEMLGKVFFKYYPNIKLIKGDV